MVMNRCASHRYSTSVWTVLLGLSFLLNPLTLSQAQVITNITPTTTAPLDLGTDVNTVGTITQITGGTRPNNGPDPGTNLFHSFDFFTLGTDDIAHFMNDMELPTTNIIGRVIGRELSTIDGTLRTNNPLNADDPMNFGAANLWLVNPSGLLLGPNARIEVGGSVSMSTANYLRFEGTSTLFDMLSTQTSLGLLSIAPVVAFGFLGSSPGSITVQGSQFSVTEGQSISLVGGNISIESGTPEGGAAQPVRLSAPNGKIDLASAASTGEFDAATLDPLPTEDGTSFSSLGSVSLAAGSSINVSGPSTVLVLGGQLVLSVNDATLSTSEIPAPEDTISLRQGSSIVTSNSGVEPGADLQITVGNLNLDGTETVVTTKTLGDGNGGNITADVGNLTLTAGAQISSQNASFGLGEGGDVQVSATDSILISGQDLVGNSSGILTDTQISGDGGSISLTAKSLTMGVAADPEGIITADPGGIIKSSTFGGGPGGEIDIDVDTMSLSNGGRITSHTGSFAPGGKVKVTATDSISLLSGVDSNGDPSGILTSSTFDGQTGDIEVDTGKLTLSGGSVIQSGSIFDPQGGSIKVHASSSVDISNGSSISSQALLLDVGNISISTPTLTMDNGSIQSTTLDFGNAGNIVVNVGTLSLSGGARIDSGTIGSGRGGTVTVQGFGGPDTRADVVQISGTDSAGQPSGLFTNAGSAGDFSSPSADGAGGDIRVFVAGGLTIDSGGTISAVSSSSSAFAQGGSITVDANQVRLSGSTITSASTVVGGEAPGGNVEINAQTLTLDSGASVSASTAGSGNAGQVVVTTPALSLNDATITTSTSSSGNAGGVMANVGTLSLTGGAEITSASTGTATGSAGSVTIQGLASPADAVTLTNSSLRTSADSTGRGGSITIDATNLILNGATISASVKDVNATDVTDGPTSGLGNIVLTSSTINMTDGTVSAETVGTRNAGSIQVTSDNLSVTGGARIEASTTGAGDAGDITITNTDTVSVTGLSSNGSSRSGIFAKTQSSGGGQTSTPGDAGNIDITTNTLLLNGGAQIDSSTTTSGSGGNVFVEADAITITGIGTSLKSDASRGNGIGGDIELAARTIGIHDKASVTAATDGSGPAGDIVMTANESFTLDSAAIITTSTRGSGSGGTILIDSPKVLVNGLGTSITASTLRPFADLAVTLNIVHPNDGDLTVRLDSPDGTRHALVSRVGGSDDNFTGTIFDDQATQPITSGSAPFTDTFKPREPLAQLIDQTVAGTWKLNVSDQVAGNAGTLRSWSLRVGDQVFQSTNIPRDIPDNVNNVNGSVSSNLVVAGPAGAVIQGVGEASGDGGDVTIKAGTMTVQNGATVSATTRGSGQGGTVNVNATGLVLTGPGTGLFTDSEASGDSGNIIVVASHMTMENGAEVSAASSGTGDAGNIMIAAPDNMVSLASGSSITSSTTGAGNAGQVIIITPTLSLDNATITTSTSSAGNAGSITANVGTLSLTGGAQITSASTGTASGAAGSVTIQGLASPADAMTLTNSSLRTSADSTGRGGSITVDATNLTLNGATISASVKDVNTADVTDGPTSGIGNIALTSSTISMTGSTVTTESSGARNAGDIKINPDVAGNSFQMQNSTINTSAAKADGGNIEINATNMVRLTNSIITSSVGNATKIDTSGGNIKIDPQFVILQNSQIRANAFAGSGGNIRIISSVFLADPFSQQNISASSQLGISGTVDILSPVQNVGEQLTPLSQQFSSAAALLAQQCAARAADGKFSTFVVAAREGLPVEPGGFLASPSWTAELFGSSLSGREPHTRFSAVTGALSNYDARPIQLAKFGGACR